MLEIGLRDVRLFNFVINICPCVHVKFNIRGEVVNFNPIIFSINNYNNNNNNFNAPERDKQRD